jgi:hypothetical protein
VFPTRAAASHGSIRSASCSSLNESRSALFLQINVAAVPSSDLLTAISTVVAEGAFVAMLVLDPSLSQGLRPARDEQEIRSARDDRRCLGAGAGLEEFGPQIQAA